VPEPAGPPQPGGFLPGPRAAVYIDGKLEKAGEVTVTIEKVREDAAIWLGRLDRGLRDGEGPALREWLKTPLHRNVLMETARLGAGPEAISIVLELFPESAIPATRSPHRKGFFAISLPAAAALAIVVFGTFSLMGTMPWVYFGVAHASPREATVRTYFTNIGERRDVQLEDGSTVSLNTGTRMVVVISTKLREVNLMYGEASFDIAHDAVRAFRVRAGQREFAALGTRFNVRVLNPQDVELTVTEGQVKVLYAPPRLPDTPAQRRSNLSWGETTLNALETARVEPGFQAVSTLEPGEVQTRLAWQRGMIIFDGTMLEDVLAEVDRYTTTKFVLADDRLRSVRIGGNFRAGDVEGLLATLRKNFLIDSRRDAQGRIVLHALATL
jgi:transmembrane sensor